MITVLTGSKLRRHAERDMHELRRRHALPDALQSEHGFRVREALGGQI